jgi:hypothetical protein
MRKRFPLPAISTAAGALLGIVSLGATALAQEWSPFDPFKNPARGQAQKASPREEAPASRPSGSDDIERPLGDSGATAVERGDLAPVMAADGSGLPYELWRGLDVGTLERLITEIDIPPRSPALHRLWLRLITSNVTPPDGGVTDQQFLALRLEILYRSGLLDEASRMLSAMPAGDPTAAILAARNEIGLGAQDKGCETVKSGGGVPVQLPRPVKADAALISGFCAAVAGDAPGAGLAAELAREAGVKESPGLQALDAIAMGSKPQVGPDQAVSLMDYRIIEAAGGAIDNASVIKRAEPSLLAALALDAEANAGDRLAAAEAAAQVNAISAEQLADIYRAQPDAGAVISDAVGTDTPQRRAGLFVAAEHERTPQKKVRLIRAFLDEAHRAGFYLTALRMVSPASDSVVAAPEIGWYAETGVEVALAAGGYAKAREWAAFGPTAGGAPAGSLNHWLALIDIAEGSASTREDDLRHVEELAVRGRIDATLLHRLATVLDALEYNVPIPLWEAASRTPQPASGHLPETGVLTELQDAAKKREFGRTVLLAMKTLGPNGAEGAHMIALGDSIRALKRAGLEADARSLGFEALFASWPRAISN